MTVKIGEKEYEGKNLSAIKRPDRDHQIVKVAQ